jgi:hypothetical protein
VGLRWSVAVLAACCGLLGTWVDAAAGSWGLGPGAHFFSAAGHDAGPYVKSASPSSLPATATAREVDASEVLALPNNAFAFLDGSEALWYRVDRRGIMTLLPGSQQLRRVRADELHVAAGPDGSLMIAAIFDVGASRIVRLSPDGQLTTVIENLAASALAVRPDGSCSPSTVPTPGSC